ncbi:MAG: M20/M25/M40 family metallo-hydrolase, partial [Planctomycetota bacterium]
MTRPDLSTRDSDATRTADPSAAMLGWIDAQVERMLERVVTLAEVNSGTTNRAGVERVAALVEPMLAELADTVERVPLPPRVQVNDDGRSLSIPSADALLATRRPNAPRRVLLNIHLDTVFGPDHPFQSVTRPDEHTLHGPGVADAKGGLIVMLTALEAFERFAAPRDVGWQIVLNPDEEIGSPAS